MYARRVTTERGRELGQASGGMKAEATGQVIGGVVGAGVCIAGSALAGTLLAPALVITGVGVGVGWLFGGMAARGVSRIKEGNLGDDLSALGRTEEQIVEQAAASGTKTGAVIGAAVGLAAGGVLLHASPVIPGVMDKLVAVATDAIDAQLIDLPSGQPKLTGESGSIEGELLGVAAS